MLGLDMFLGASYETILYMVVFYNIIRLKFGKLELLLYALGYLAVDYLVTIPFYFFPDYRTQLSVVPHIIAVMYFTIVASGKLKSIYPAGFYAVLTVSVPLISNLLVTAIFAVTGIIETFNFAAYWGEQSTLIFALVIMMASSASISYFLGKGLDKRMGALDGDMRDRCSKYLFASSVMILLLLFYAVLFRWFVDTELLGIVFLFMAIVLVVSLIFTISVFTDAVKSALYAQEKEYYLAQCHIMQESVEQIKAIRHDMKIHLATINGYAAERNADEITNYLNTLLQDINDAEIYSNTGNVAVDSIINYKLKDAKKENIQLEIRLALPPAINIEGADLATILGNLLDNAMRAVSTADNKIIELDIEYSRESLFIHISNTFDPAADLKGEGGYGLKNVKQAVERYNGHMDITLDEKYSASIVLYISCP
ncbi:MAG: GHKL domain-containing protein [Defluviitaleaceae bacterium]|nr:GHKL domain-containing protein [Defluviitaleaceae bacterium]